MSVPVDLVLPVLVMGAMAIVGLELELADLGRVLHYPTHVVVSVVGQGLTLPVIGASLIAWLEPSPEITGGLILVSVAPQATAANFLCLIGRANLALSVTVTGVSCLLALVTTPLAARVVFDVLLDRAVGFDLPYVPVMQQIFLGMLLPVAAGMLVRHFAPDFVARQRMHLRTFTIVALFVMLGLMAADQGKTIVRELPAIVVAGTLFTIAATAVGAGVALAFRWPGDEVLTTAAGFSLRSLSVATLVSINVLGSTRFLAFAAPFFVVQALLMVPAMLLCRRFTEGALRAPAGHG